MKHPKRITDMKAIRKKYRAILTGLGLSLLADQGMALPLGYIPDVVSPFYFTGNGSNTQGQFGIQGIKSWSPEGWFILTGTSGSNGAVYLGPIDHGATTAPKTSNSDGSATLTPVSQIPTCQSAGGSGSGQGNCNSSSGPVTQGGWYVMNYSGYSTSIYGPDVIGNGNVNLVGSLVPASGSPTIGFYYSGPVTNTPNQSSFTPFQATNSSNAAADYTFIHSVSGGSAGVPLAVGNYGYQGSGTGNPWGYAFIYNPKTNTKIDIPFPDRTTEKTHTAYGIWYNGNGTYTIAGGVGLGSEPTSYYVYGWPLPLGEAYLMDYNPSTGLFTNYQTFTYTPKGANVKLFRGKSLITHFEGIWRDPNTGTYRLPATVSYTSATGKPSFDLAKAMVATVRRDGRGRFQKTAVWNEVDVPGATVVTNDSLSGDTNVGLAIYPAVYDSKGQQISGSIYSDYAETPIKRQ